MKLPTTISLLHATYRAGDDALRVRAQWLERASDAGRVEHVFALDADDEISVAATKGLTRVVSPSISGQVTAVRNWNAAAAVATGQLLFVIADDLTPPDGWDVILDAVVGTLDPDRFAFAVRVADTDLAADSRPTLMRHPVVSRRFFETLGLFDPAFTGVYCDDDITLRSFRHAVVIDGSKLLLRHGRDATSPTPSQVRINAEEEYTRGLQVFDRRWGTRRPPPTSAYFRPSGAVSAVRLWAFAWRWRLRAGIRSSDARKLARRVVVASTIRIRRLVTWARQRSARG